MLHRVGVRLILMVSKNLFFLLLEYTKIEYTVAAISVSDFKKVFPHEPFGNAKVFVCND